MLWLQRIYIFAFFGIKEWLHDWCNYPTSQCVFSYFIVQCLALLFFNIILSYLIWIIIISYFVNFSEGRVAQLVIEKIALNSIITELQESDRREISMYMHYCTFTYYCILLSCFCCSFIQFIRFAYIW